MKTYIIAYDLNKYESSSDYQKIINAIKGLGNWTKPLESTWLVKTSSSSSEIRNYLKQFIDNNDELLIINVPNANWATQGIKEDVLDWMHKNI
ncbi:MAG: SinR family protein [Candidatus Pacebacteria bacterium]|nr:SinR family protein [Candidatus Paceibacterota bacterium]